MGDPEIYSLCSPRSVCTDLYPHPSSRSHFTLAKSVCPMQSCVCVCVCVYGPSQSTFFHPLKHIFISSKLKPLALTHGQQVALQTGDKQPVDFCIIPHLPRHIR
eukprot:GGOE01048977.1.p2 GENE.GGOE01048977.1~~GGOE01048977.1.p2  ORF type:complete len:104 (+),score=2.34 GGOE01048977.1:31-342(+)